MQMTKFTIGWVASVLLICSFPFSIYSEELIQQLQIYDSQSNYLLRVNFQYNGNNENTSRTIYDPNGYVLHHAEVQREGEVESRTNYTKGNGEVSQYVTYSNKENVKTVNIFNAFNEVQLQASYDKTSPNHNYQFSDGHRVVYELGNGNKISKIKLFDTEGILSHYAVVNDNVAVLEPHDKQQFVLTHLRKIKQGKALLAFNIEKAKIVKAELFNIHGSLVHTFLNRKFEKGTYREIVDLEAQAQKIPPGLFILTISLGKKQNLYKMKLIK